LRVKATLLGNFVGSNLIFALVHGVFVALFVFGYLGLRPAPADLGRGVDWLLAAMTTPGAPVVMGDDFDRAPLPVGVLAAQAHVQQHHLAGHDVIANTEASQA
jgi:hypothetical protein